MSSGNIGEEGYFRLKLSGHGPPLREVRWETWKKELVQNLLKRKAADCPGPQSLFDMLSYVPPKANAFSTDRALQHQVLINKLTYKLAYMPVLKRPPLK